MLSTKTEHYRLLFARKSFLFGIILFFLNESGVEAQAFQNLTVLIAGK